MKRILLSAFVGLFALLGSQAHAVITIRQNDDGTADFVGRAAESPEFANCVGAVQIQTMASSASTIATTVAISPITNAVLRNVQVALPQLTNPATGQAALQFYVGRVNDTRNTTFPLVYRTQIPATAQVATTVNLIVDYTNSPSRIGRVFTISSRAQAGPFVSEPRLMSNILMRNDPIFIQVTTAATPAISIPVLLTLCPR